MAGWKFTAGQELWRDQVTNPQRNIIAEKEWLWVRDHLRRMKGLKMAGVQICWRFVEKLMAFCRG